MRRRLAMAVEAPGHAERLDLLHHFHLVNSTVAGDTADSASHVSAVIEARVIGQVMDAFPFNGGTAGLAFEYGQKLFTVGMHRNGGDTPVRISRVVTVIAGLSWWDGRVCCFFDCRVAITAVQLQLTSVQFVTERHWLLRCVTNVCRFR